MHRVQASEKRRACICVVRCKVGQSGVCRLMLVTVKVPGHALVSAVQLCGTCSWGMRASVQVVGPHETARSGELLGGPQAAARLLAQHGWEVVYLQVGQLPAGLPRRQQLSRLADLLRRHGVPAKKSAARQKQSGVADSRAPVSEAGSADNLHL